MQTRRWRVLVADDEPAARRGVRQLLSPYPQFTIVGECRDGHEALAAIDSLHPDVLFLDIQMPEIDGFEVIRRRSPERMPVVVFLTAYDQFAIRAFEADASLYRRVVRRQRALIDYLCCTRPLLELMRTAERVRSTRA